MEAARRCQSSRSSEGGPAQGERPGLRVTGAQPQQFQRHGRERDAGQQLCHAGPARALGHDRPVRRGDQDEPARDRVPVDRRHHGQLEGRKAGEGAPQLGQEGSHIPLPPRGHPLEVHPGREHRAGAGQHHRGGALGGGLIQRSAQRPAQLGVQRVGLAVPHGQYRHAVLRDGFDHRWPPLRSWHQLPAEDLRWISPAQPSGRNPCHGSARLAGSCEAAPAAQNDISGAPSPTCLPLPISVHQAGVRAFSVAPAVTQRAAGRRPHACRSGLDCSVAQDRSAGLHDPALPDMDFRNRASSNFSSNNESESGTTGFVESLVRLTGRGYGR